MSIPTRLHLQVVINLNKIGKEEGCSRLLFLIVLFFLNLSIFVYLFIFMNMNISRRLQVQVVVNSKTREGNLLSAHPFDIPLLFCIFLYYSSLSPFLNVYIYFYKASLAGHELK